MLYWTDGVRSTGKEVEMVVPTSSASEDHTVRMECCSGDGCSLGTLKEAGVGLQTRELMSVKVEDLDLVR